MKAKKNLGQHFLIDQSIIEAIASYMPPQQSFEQVIEVGPGMGAITETLSNLFGEKLVCIELDQRMVQHLSEKHLGLKVYNESILTFDLHIFNAPILLIGNFPYNISSQILFKVLEHVDTIKMVIGMFQKEVGLRVCSTSGKKDNGVLSILIQYYYDAEVLIEIGPDSFSPPPRVDSNVIRLARNNRNRDDAFFLRLRKIVNTAFQQRRKTLRNSLKAFNASDKIPNEVLQLRPEQLNVSEFIELTHLIYG